MNPIISVTDQFFPSFPEARRALLDGVYEDIVNPVDGVVYPAIQRVLHAGLQRFVRHRLCHMVRREVQVTAMFSRAMFEGMGAPNKIHSDRVMGRYAAHIYMSEAWPEGAGTSFWTNLEQGPEHHGEIDTSRIRPNEMADWERYKLVQAAPNRCLVHDGHAWHLAEPIGGWGREPADARLVITCFFD